jgi:hypothetical protein
MKYQIKLDILPILQKDILANITSSLTKDEWLKLGLDPEKLTGIFESVLDYEINVTRKHIPGWSHNNVQTSYTIDIISQDFILSEKDIEDSIRKTIITLTTTNKKEAYSESLVHNSLDELFKVEPDEKTLRKQIVSKIINECSFPFRYCSVEGGCNCMGCVNMNSDFIQADITHEEWSEWVLEQPGNEKAKELFGKNKKD